MSTESPELIVARNMRDHARSLRSLAQDHEVAAVALKEEQRLSRQVEKLEREQVQPELPALAGAA